MLRCTHLRNLTYKIGLPLVIGMIAVGRTLFMFTFLTLTRREL